MSKFLRVKCKCGNVANALPGHVCPNCRQPYEIPVDGVLQLYRMGNFIGCAGGFGIYINGQPYGHIGNRESLRIPLSYGSYNIHIAAGMNRRCTDMIVNITPENQFAYMKIWIKPGFWSNTFVLEPCDPSEMPPID